MTSRQTDTLSNYKTRGPNGHISCTWVQFDRSARAAIFVYWSAQKNINLLEDAEILLPVKFCWIPFSGFREVENVSANQRPGWPSYFFDRLEKHKLGRGRWDLASFHVKLNLMQQFQRRSRNVSANQRPGQPSFFPICRKNTNFVEYVEILLPVKFRWIP